MFLFSNIPPPPQPPPKRYIREDIKAGAVYWIKGVIIGLITIGILMLTSC